MSQLAIRGHAIRGEEVIEVLEMLGGKNVADYSGSSIRSCYFLNNDIICSSYDSVKPGIDYYTLEEFLEKYPYKVGNKVTHSDYESPLEIVGMKWENDSIKYEVYTNDYGYWFGVDELQPYKEETMEERKLSDLRLDADQDDKLATEATIDGSKITPPENYLIGKITKVNNGMLVEFVKKQPQYPKTYEECIGQLPINWDLEVKGYKCELLLAFQKLLIARDVYWKLYGKQMGLEKPWEPDFTNDNEERYGIYTTANKVEKDFCGVGDVNVILTFPTEEMRDAFYENFKDLIEQCKELL